MMNAEQWRTKKPNYFSPHEWTDVRAEAYAAYVSGEKCKRLVEAANNIIAHRHYNAWAADRSNAMDALAAALAAVREAK